MTGLPEIGSRVVTALGLHSMLSYRMDLGAAGVIAGMNLYAEDVDAFDEARPPRGACS